MGEGNAALETMTDEDDCTLGWCVLISPLSSAESGSSHHFGRLLQTVLLGGWKMESLNETQQLRKIRQIKSFGLATTKCRYEDYVLAKIYLCRLLLWLGDGLAPVVFTCLQI